MAVRMSCILALVGLAGAVHLRGPDDHFIHEAIDHSNHTAEEPALPHQKEFIALDRNADGSLDVRELMFQQYSSGCDPLEAQIRATDYMRCGDMNKDGKISAQEFEESMKPAWAECIRASSDRRAHTFYRFMEADDDFDGKLTELELRVEVLRMWGPAGEELVEPLLICTDSNKDLKIDSDEFHKSLAVYSPATRSWHMMYHDGDKQVLVCLEGAMAKFNTHLVFIATDTNKDNKVSKPEAYSALMALEPTIQHATADKLFADADLNKDNFLSLEEFEAAGANHKPIAAAFFAAMNSTTVAAGEVSGMGAVCHARPIPEEYSLWSEAKAITNQTKAALNATKAALNATKLF